jgi:Bifunctional DNA primase/polymerase, N-terminal
MHMYPDFRLVTPWTQHSLIQAALSYAHDRGWPIFPLAGKRPLVSRGFYQATTDEARIRSWWTRWPWANIGLPTGTHTGIWVVDVDAQSDGFTSLQKVTSRVPLDLTATVSTGGGGLHLYFARRTDLDFPLKNATALAGYSGIDLRVDGGYVVAPPSRHDSGGWYQWLNDLPPARFPDVFVELARPRHRSATQALTRSGHPQRDRTNPAYWLHLALSKAQEGARHRYALFLACRLIADVGLSQEQAESYLAEYVRQVPVGSHPYTFDDALACLRWAVLHA